MSNAGNKGIFSNNIGSSVGAFTNRDSSDAGSGAASGSTAERRRVSRLDFLSPLSCPPSQSLFLASHPYETLLQFRRPLPCRLPSS